MLTLSQSGGADYAHPLALPHLKFFMITPLHTFVIYAGLFPLTSNHIPMYV